MTPDQIDALIRDVNDLLNHSDFDREVIKAAMRSVFSAMERVGADDRADLKELVDAFIADPHDKDIMARLGALLRDAQLPEH